MSLFQTAAVKSRRTYPPTAFQAGQMMAAVFEHTFDEAFTAASDILEIGLLPAGAKLLEATLISGALGSGVTATLSVMDGEPGAKDSARAAATDIQTGIAAHSATTPLNVNTLTAFPASDSHRALGLEFSADITAGGTKTVKLVIYYHF